jgi:hypothetical protein
MTNLHQRIRVGGKLADLLVIPTLGWETLEEEHYSLHLNLNIIFSFIASICELENLKILFALDLSRPKAQKRSANL